ncbi:MAG: FkbM family methyltransferase, partial [Candidatus Omnitrophota bacterium]
GFWIKLDLNDWPDRMFFFGINEPDHIRFLDVLLRPGDMCFDVGANKGFYALQMARAVGSSGAVFAFEPDSRVWPMLQENAKRNNFTNLKVLPLAVSDKSGSAVFSLSSQIGWSGFVPSVSPHHKVVRTETVRVVSLDGFFEDMKLRSHKDCILFIKIDAEGSEKMIIDGMERVLTDYDPVFHIEINDKGPNGLALLAHLRAKGYHVYTLDLDANKKELKLRPVEGIPQADIVAFRDSPMVGQRLKDIL